MQCNGNAVREDADDDWMKDDEREIGQSRPDEREGS